MNLPTIELYSYVHGVWLPSITALLLLILIFYSWPRRNVPSARPFAIGCLFAALWAIGSVMEYAAVDNEVKILWIKFQGVWQLPAVTAIACFLLEFTFPGRWVTRRNLVLLSVVPLLCLALILTNDIHHLVWRDFNSDGVIQPRIGPAGWIAIAYGCGLSLICFIILAWLCLHVPQQRWLGAILIVGLVGVLAMNLWEKIQGLHTFLPLDMLGMAFFFLMCSIALFNFHFLDPIPLAYRTAIDQVHRGVLVLDHEGKVITLNPFAEQIFGVPASHAVGQPVVNLLPAYADGPANFDDGLEIDISLGTGPGVRYYALAKTGLKDWRGLDIGCLLLLRDITDQKLIQSQIIKQEQVLAALQERERLARELHDNLGQVLGYASFQLEAAAKLNRNGQAETAADQLDCLANVIRETHADVRQFILNLRSTPCLDVPFITRLQQHVDGFTNNYAIQAYLTVDIKMNGKTYSPDMQMQILRIMQEALWNARKHSHAHRVQVKLEAEDGQTRMTIEDDGCGFSLDKLEKLDVQHFGLRFMQERAAQMGGSLQLQSTPGKGTRVTLLIPGKDL